VITTRVIGAGLFGLPDRRIIRRMPRLQVYLPDKLYRAVKERQLPASELLQGAVRAELRRQELLEETDRYLSELIEEVGEPSPASVAKGERLAGRVRGEKTRVPKAS
jgi:post-segregation antitoxin (ccd killing protein)